MPCNVLMFEKISCIAVFIYLFIFIYIVIILDFVSYFLNGLSKVFKSYLNIFK